MEKVLIECCLELYSAGLVIGIQDLGGAGLSCATSELASAGDGGMAIQLDTVPLRAKDMTPAEILSSESQERMCAVVAPENVDAFMAVCRKWEVLATTIGEVTDGDRLQITWHDETVVDVPPRTVAHEGPVYQRPVARPESQDALIADTSASLKRPVSGDELRATLLALLGSPHLCSRAFITEQYDRYVRGNTVLAEHADGGVLRVDESTGRGVAVSTDASGRYTLLDPYVGAQLALAEAYRNVAVTGATPPGGWLCCTGHSGYRRQRQLLQSDRDHRNHAHPGRRRPGGDRRRRPPHSDRDGHRTGRDADSARRHTRRIRRLDLGPGHRRSPGRTAALGKPEPRASAGRRVERSLSRRAGIGGS
jgi:phosphoribosylformylglycinamidine (FGAM) synthase-like enzyme